MNSEQSNLAIRAEELETFNSTETILLYYNLILNRVLRYTAYTVNLR